MYKNRRLYFCLHYTLSTVVFYPSELNIFSLSNISFLRHFHRRINARLLCRTPHHPHCQNLLFDTAQWRLGEVRLCNFTTRLDSWSRSEDGGGERVRGFREGRKRTTQQSAAPDELLIVDRLSRFEFILYNYERSSSFLPRLVVQLVPVAFQVGFMYFNSDG